MSCAAPILFFKRVRLCFYRLVETLCFALKSRQDEGWRENRKNYKCMLDEDVDLTLIRLFENFLENAPQLTLQLYIMTAFGTEDDYMLSKCNLQAEPKSQHLSVQ